MPEFSSEDKKLLLDAARRAIGHRLDGRSEPLTDAACFQMKRGCFVTLNRHGMLRGCMGTFDDAATLGENLVRMACAAAFRDPRFPPVHEKEMSDLRIEISILGPMKKMKAPEDLVVGRHGIWVQCGDRGGTYLPDVAVEQGWNAAEFIRDCACRKAGLSESEAAAAEVYLYEVEKISEND